MKSFSSQISDCPPPFFFSPLCLWRASLVPCAGQEPCLARGRAEDRRAGNLQSVAFFLHGENGTLLVCLGVLRMLPAEISMVLFSNLFVETFSLSL